MERAGLKIASKTTLGNVGTGTQGGRSGEGWSGGTEKALGDVRDLPKGRVSSPIKCSGLWRPDLTAPSPLPVPWEGSLGKRPWGGFWLDHSVPSRSWDQVTDQRREQAG